MVKSVPAVEEAKSAVPVVVWPAGPSARTPVFVTLPPEYVRPEEKVVVATQVGSPLTSARVCPLVPVVVVLSAPAPFPYKSAPDWTAAQPVPPFATPRILSESVEPESGRKCEGVHRTGSVAHENTGERC